MSVEESFHSATIFSCFVFFTASLFYMNWRLLSGFVCKSNAGQIYTNRHRCTLVWITKTLADNGQTHLVMGILSYLRMQCSMKDFRTFRRKAHNVWWCNCHVMWYTAKSKLIYLFRGKTTRCVMEHGRKLRLLQLHFHFPDPRHTQTHKGHTMVWTKDWFIYHVVKWGTMNDCFSVFLQWNNSWLQIEKPNISSIRLRTSVGSSCRVLQSINFSHILECKVSQRTSWIETTHLCF